MGIPDDVVLDGYTLIEQHEIDHEFLLHGSPLGTETPLLFALSMVGIVLVAASLFLRGGQPRCRRPSGRVAHSDQALVDAGSALAALRRRPSIWLHAPVLPAILAGRLHHRRRHCAYRLSFGHFPAALAGPTKQQLAAKHCNGDVHPVSAIDLGQDVFHVRLDRGQRDE